MPDPSKRVIRRIELAPTKDSNSYHPEMIRLLTIIGKVTGHENPEQWAQHCLVTDESWVGDFVMPAERERLLPQLEAKLGIPVKRNTPLIEVCALMRALTSA